MNLKASKTQLYRLVQTHYPDIPPMRQTEFLKALHSRSWWLKFDMPDGHCEVYFSAVMGQAVLSLSSKFGREVTEIPIAELKQLDLVEGDDTDGND